MDMKASVVLLQLALILRRAPLLSETALASSSWLMSAKIATCVCRVGNAVSLSYAYISEAAFFNDQCSCKDCPKRKACGYTIDGTFAEFVVAAVDQVVPIPDGLKSPDAAAVMCAVRAAP